MNAITAAQSLPPVYTPAVSVQVKAIEQAVSTTQTSPSTSVTLGEAVTAPPPIYTANGTLGGAQVRYAFEHESTDKLSSTLLDNIQASASAGGRFKGLGAALLAQLAANGGKSISQSVLTVGTEQADAGVLKLQLEHLRAHPASSLSFNLTTASGATISLSLASGEKGLSVIADVHNGELSSEELEGLAAMADDFQSAIDGLTQVPPRLQLGNLVKLDSSLFSSLQLNASLVVSGELQTFDLSLDDSARKLALNGPSGRVEMNLDTPSAALLGSTAQRQAAIDSYLSQFDAALKRGKGDANLMGLFKDAFTQLNAVDERKQAVSERVSLLSATDRALLSGLADFNASISQPTQHSNPMRLEESDRFEYQASQSTTIKNAGGVNRSVQQEQQAGLKAAYHQGLNPLTNMQLGLDKESQNYRYHEINDQSSSSTRLAYENNRLVQASATQQASQSERVRTYVNADLVDDVTTPTSATETHDLLNLLTDAFRDERLARQANDASILDETLQGLRSRWQLQSNPADIAR
ncbi:hypothetical protein CCOS865_02314 [Pseudomonas reidholzensis]|uniref:Lactate dehydrogenase n=1 Tax=Pseudomonas reidholzensis TaxID=1785162 RepID=A0A383RUI6_9PSED|nr:hypothetical protein [Pseudomonas reidholzensis]SYX90048.1 hypothetical protein CCOS865_02314 [Pseudomonas reidholzensis]